MGIPDRTIDHSANYEADVYIAIIENTINSRKPKDIEQGHDFVRWIDHDWQEIKA